jgi:tetratricopeptide (TPR) repeat protein
MNQPSRTIRVFISSTFRDFAEERNLLVRKVFPELRRKCRERQVELVDVDLRWGITEEEAKQGKILPICLAEIDRSRPYFIGLLGERYGWVPDKAQYDLSLLLEQPWLEEHRGGKSVTELEILHGVLNNPEMAGHAFFYFRDPAWSAQHGNAYASEDPEEKARVSTLKDRIRQSCFPVVENYPDPDALVERVREDLWRLIDETFPPDSVPDSLTRERFKHEAYSAPLQRLYLGEENFKALDEAMSSENFLPVLITGRSGDGKSALLANWVPRWSMLHPKTSVILHHLGAGADAADPVRIVVRLIKEIARLTGDEFKPESDPEKQLKELPQWLALGSAWAEREGRELLLVLDGLDLNQSDYGLLWLPSFWPKKVKLVVSCSYMLIGTENFKYGPELMAAKERIKWREVEVMPFSSSAQERFIIEYLDQYRKSLTSSQIRKLQTHPLSSTPLFLLTVLEELRVFGVHELLDQRLDTLLSPPPSKGKDAPPTLDDVFEHRLARIEEDLGEEIIQASMEAIWASNGLRRDDLLEVAQLSPAAWAAIQNALDDSLHENNGEINFRHDYLRDAVADRYGITSDRRKYLHRQLAVYFSSLPVDGNLVENLVWQWILAGDMEELKACLTNLEVFLALKQSTRDDLSSLWRDLSVNISDAYEAAWSQWDLQGERRGTIAKELADFLETVGSHSAFAHGLREEVLRTRREKQGCQHPDTLDAMHSLANSYSHSGRMEEALKLREEVLRLRREKLGAEHPDTLSAMHNLAVSYKDAGRSEEMLELVEEVLRLSREKLGAEHPYTLTAMHSLANSYSHSGRMEEALKLREEVLRLRREKLGAEHPDTLSAMHNLAVSYKDAGRSEEALELREEVLRLRREKLGIEHPDTLNAMHNLAVSYKDAGRSEEMLEELLRLRREKLGNEHPDTLNTMLGLAICYVRKFRWKEAKSLFEGTKRLALDQLGPQHAVTKSAIKGLAGYAKIKLITIGVLIGLFIMILILAFISGSFLIRKFF